MRRVNVLRLSRLALLSFVWVFIVLFQPTPAEMKQVDKSFALDNAQFEPVRLNNIAPSSELYFPLNEPTSPSELLEEECASIMGCPTYFTLSIISDPSSATVFIDGKPYGFTPLDMQISENSTVHTITVRKDGYNDYTQQHKFSEGNPSLTINLQKKE